MPPANPLQALADRWAAAKPAERANAQLYITELCEALGVERPRPAGSGYEFELAIKVVSKDGEEATNFIDCWKAGHFALEAKDYEAGISEERLLRKAFGQVRNYVSHVPGGLPPFLMVLDVGKSLRVWEGWGGRFGDFHAAKRIDLPTLAERPAEIALLKAIWEDPTSLDPRTKAAKVTKEIAAKLAELAASLEDRGHSQEEVARFLIRVMFTMFAEDVDLLPGETFEDLLSDVPLEELPAALEDLWKAMDKGRRFGGRKLAQFNGKFFEDSKALPLSAEDKTLLILAAQKEWQDVEPSIFGTLMVRALDPEERHRLGAEFTPREYVERLVRPTVEEPVREKWTLVQAQVLQLRETGKEKDRKAALKAVQEFHEWLCGLQILDPACGSGNFLYVTLHMLKRVEMEVRALENELRKEGDADFRLFEVHPRQFHGIEIKPWAREIAELTLWIGYHQFWKQYEHVEHPEPILEDTGTIECRDAVLEWDEIRHDPKRDRPDPTPRIKSPVTGELVPDPALKLPYLEYIKPRPATWPRADFIVGNPPYIGKSRKRAALGDGYVDALQSAYPTVPPSADFVMLWWEQSVSAVAAGSAQRAGLITTNSIVQKQNRVVIEQSEAQSVAVTWAVADHPWYDGVETAAVRVAMSVLAKSPESAVLVTVDEGGNIVSTRKGAKLNSDLSLGVNVVASASAPLLSNAGLATVGFKLYGDGFILTKSEVQQLTAAEPGARAHIRPFLNGRDVAARPREVSVVDFGTLSLAQASETPLLLDYVRDRVKAHREANANKDIATRWWQFGHVRAQLREMTAGLPFFIVTPETARHRYFVPLRTETAAEGKLFCVGLSDWFAVGVLSAAIHLVWVEATSGRLGVGNDNVYNKGCFDPFPFPGSADQLTSEHIARTAERLVALRATGIERDERVTMTGIYNVVAKLRSDEALTPKEREIHALAGCGVIKDLHDELDSLVAKAYGWSWPLEEEEILARLVALHDERVEEEKRGKVRWLRPEYQIPRFGKDLPGAGELALEAKKGGKAVPAAATPKPWPKTAVDQLGAIKSVLAGQALTATEVLESFEGAEKVMVKRHLETLELMGELSKSARGKFSLPR